ncbi:MAG: efflux RND transporter periplasmic adaptor subunit, partial [Pseudomonadota bacterium]
MRYVVFVIVIAAAGVTAWLFRNDLPTLLADRGPPPAAAEAPPPPTVTVAQPLALELVEWDEFIGRFEAIERVDIRARVGGYLAEVPVADGATVAADDVLFVVDRFPFTLAVDRAQAQLDRAQANVEFASLELERTRGLIARNAASQAAFDERTLDLATAEAELADARAALGQAQLDLGFTTVRAPFPGR